MIRSASLLVCLALLAAPSALAQSVQTAPAATSPRLSGLPGDPRPDAPALSARGAYAVGVQTVQMVNPDQLDIVHAPKEGAIDRKSVV